MWNQSIVRALVGVGAISLVATPAAAQATNSVSVGYSFLRFTEGNGLNIPAGWNVSVAGGGNDVVNAVADIGGHYKEGESLHTFQGGVRFSARQNPKVVPFAQVVAGAGVVAGDGDAEAVWALSPGAGIDVLVGESGAGLRAQVDFPIFFDEGISTNTLRFTVGVVIPFN